MAKKELNIRSWDEIDGTMRRLAEIERLESKSKTAMNQEIDALKLRYSDDLKSITDERKQLEKDLAAFVKANRADFQGKQSKVMTYAVLMFRKSKSIMIHSVGIRLQLSRRYTARSRSI